MKGKIILILLSIVIVSCKTNGIPENFDYGKVENNIYTNSFFNLNMTLPTDWVVQTKEQNDQLMKLGQEMLANDNENLKAAIKASEINTANLLTIFEHEVGSVVEYNPSMVLIVENLRFSPGIKSGKDYLTQSKKVLKQTQIKYNNIDDTKFEKVNVNKQDFYLMNLSLNHLNMNIKQGYYSILKNGFSINVIISYVTEKQKQELEKILNTLKFT